MKVNLRARFLELAHEIQGDHLPVWFREHTQNSATLAPAFTHWAKLYHHRARLALFDYRLRRLKEWQKATITTSATA